MFQCWVYIHSSTFTLLNTTICHWHRKNVEIIEIIERRFFFDYMKNTCGSLNGITFRNCTRTNAS